MFFFFSSRRRHTRCSRDWSSDVCSSDLRQALVDAVEIASGQAMRLTLVKVGPPADVPVGQCEHRLGLRQQRSEEHTSELQSRLHLVCRLLLEKKKTKHLLQYRTTLDSFG